MIMTKIITYSIITILVLFGISSAKELDTIVGHISTARVTKDLNVPNLLKDTALLIAPTTDAEEYNNFIRSEKIFSVEDLGSDDNYAYSLETFNNYSQITMIPLAVFPNWLLADNTEGYSTRGTDTWCEVAKNPISKEESL